METPQAPTPKDQKQFNLTASETQLLALIRNQQQAVLSIVLSYIADTRLAYHVTQRTHFELNGDMTGIKIGELEDQIPVVNAEPAADGSGVKTSEGGQVA